MPPLNANPAISTITRSASYQSGQIATDEVVRILDTDGPMTIPDLQKTCGLREDALLSILSAEEGERVRRVGGKHFNDYEILWAVMDG